jgi:hypothetical protein
MIWDCCMLRVPGPPFGSLNFSDRLLVLMVLETEFGYREVNEVVVIDLQPPLRQEVERRHRPGHTRTQISPDALTHLLAMEDSGQQRKDRFHQHPSLPCPALTHFPVHGIPRSSREHPCLSGPSSSRQTGRSGGENAPHGRSPWRRPRHRPSPTDAKQNTACRPPSTDDDFSLFCQSGACCALPASDG